MLCAQGVSPQAATIDALPRARARPRAGHRAARGLRARARSAAGCCCSSEFGTWRLEDVLAFAIGYAEDGYPGRARHHRDDRARRAARCASGPARPSCTCPRRSPARRSATRGLRRRGGACSTRRAAARARTSSSARARVYYEGFVAEEIDRFSREQRRPADGRRPRRLARDARAAGDASTTAG